MQQTLPWQALPPQLPDPEFLLGGLRAFRGLKGLLVNFCGGHLGVSGGPCRGPAQELYLHYHQQPSPLSHYSSLSSGYGKPAMSAPWTHKEDDCAVLLPLLTVPARPNHLFEDTEACNSTN